MIRQYSAGAQVCSKCVPGEMTTSAQESMAELHRLIEIQIFQAVQRVVMDEGAHGPVLGHDFPAEAHDAAKFHAAGVGIDPASYFSHAGISLPAVPSPVTCVRFSCLTFCSEIGSTAKKPTGITPNAAKSASMMAKDANSGARRSWWPLSGRWWPNSSVWARPKKYLEAANQAIRMTVRPAENAPAFWSAGASTIPRKPENTANGGSPNAAST